MIPPAHSERNASNGSEFDPRRAGPIIAMAAAMTSSKSAAQGKDAALRERDRYDPAASLRAQGI